MASFLSMLRAQADLQEETYGYKFQEMSDEERSAYISWNVLALTDELHEALHEVGWKPWASSRHLNVDQYIGETVDAFHFLMNLLLATGIKPEELAGRFSAAYFEKHARNTERQRDGYTGVKEKCPSCARDLGEVALREVHDSESGLYVTYCVCGQPLWRSDTPA